MNRQQKPTIAVVGATGAQGGGVVEAILEHGRFAARALTRKPQEEKGRALAARGVEVVEADLDDVASLERALDGADAAFFVTNFWEHFSPEKELAQAKNLAQAAATAGLKHVVWSTLEDTRLDVPLSDDRMPTLMGRYKVPHFDAKGEADTFFRDLPTTYYRASYYWENLIYFGMGPRRGEAGELELNLPLADKPMAGVAAGDIGRIAYGIFERGEELIGELVGAGGEVLTGEQMAQAMSRALGEPVHYRPLPVEVYRSLGFPAAEDLGNMFQYYQEFEEKLSAVRSPARSRELYPGTRSFDQWLEENAGRLVVEQPAA